MYDVLMNTQVVGKAQVSKEGLYYRFSCQCTPPDDGIFRIIVSDGTNTKDLGISVPERETVSRIAIKYLPGKNLSFSLISKEKLQMAIPVKTDEPFACLDKLDTASLQEKGEQTEILIDPAQVPQDSDLNQEYPHIWEQP